MKTRFARLAVVLASYFVIVAMLAQPAYAFSWSITLLFGHQNPNSASPTGGPRAPNGGDEDLGVDYPNGSTRNVYVEGSYVGWTSSEVSYIQSNSLLYREALVFHAFVRNSGGNCANFSYNGAWSNLPGLSFTSKATCGGPTNETRFAIGSPGSLSSGATYYAQSSCHDNNYPGSKQDGEFDISDYWILLTYGTFWKDFMQKECISPTDVFSGC